MGLVIMQMLRITAQPEKRPGLINFGRFYSHHNANHRNLRPNHRNSSGKYSMSDDLSVRIRGIAEIQRALYQYNKRLGDRVTTMALRLGANYMLKHVRANTPVSSKGSMIGKKGGTWVRGKPGRLKAAVKVKASRINRRATNGVVGVFLTISPGKKRDDPTAWE